MMLQHRDLFECLSRASQIPLRSTSLLLAGLFMSRQRGVDVGKRGGPTWSTARIVTNNSARTPIGISSPTRKSQAGRRPRAVS